MLGEAAAPAEPPAKRQMIDPPPKEGAEHDGTMLPPPPRPKPQGPTPSAESKKSEDSDDYFDDIAEFFENPSQSFQEALLEKERLKHLRNLPPLPAAEEPHEYLRDVLQVQRHARAMPHCQ